MLDPVMFTGGVYKHDLVTELIEDLGGYLLQKNVTQSEIILLMLVPHDDMPVLEALNKELRGKLERAPSRERRSPSSPRPSPSITSPTRPATSPSTCGGTGPRAT